MELAGNAFNGGVLSACFTVMLMCGPWEMIEQVAQGAASQGSDEDVSEACSDVEVAATQESVATSASR